MLGWGMMGFTAALLKDARLLNLNSSSASSASCGAFCSLDDESMGFTIFPA
jgi:hypothetical protein